MAPEVCMGREYSTPVDIWSIGIITHILLTGRPPIGGRTRDELFDSIKNKPLQIASMPPVSRDFVMQCL